MLLFLRRHIAPIFAGIVLLILFMVGGTGSSDARPLLLLPNFRVPTGVVVIVSALTGSIGSFWLSSRVADTKTRWPVGYAALLPILAVAGALMLAASLPVLSLPRAVAGMLLSTLAMIAGIRCIELVAAGESIGFETHWGGLGGGSGGWKLLPAAALAVLTLTLAGSALAVLIVDSSKPSQRQASPPVPSNTASS